MQAKSKPQFSALTIKHNGIAKRIVTDVGITPAFDPAQFLNKDIPYEIVTKKALWDTGSTNSVITPATARELNLTPTGVADVIHYGGSKQSHTYLLNFFLPNKVLIYGVRVTESADIIKDFGVIIGMDIITRGDFSVTNVSNLTWMSYRIPSIQGLDYVVDADRIRYAGVNKYGPCPCGKKDENGKPVKFKFCHGKDLERRFG